MYRVQLAESYFPAQTDSPVLPTTVGGILREQARVRPQAEAMVECDVRGELCRRWTYGELLADAERLAGALLSRYRPGERICVWAPNVPEWVLLQYAAGLAGLTLVTANPSYRSRELRFVLEQSKAAGLFLIQSYRGSDMAAIAAEATSGLSRLREIVDLSDHGALFAGEGCGADLPVVRPDDPVQIQYTSGTTGFPKGVLLCHGAITNKARYYFERLRAGRAYLNVMPLFHVAGSCLSVLGGAQMGLCMVLAAQFDPERILDLMEAERVDFLLGVPTMLVALAEAQSQAPRDLSAVRSAVSGGAMVPPELVRRVRDVFGVTIQTVYGQTEWSGLISMIQPDDAFEDACDTTGQPFPQTEVSIRAPGADTVVPIGETGEICARGYGVMLGYNDNPDATAAAIGADGWLRTGDLGAMDARGYLRITGRVKEMIIRGGENLFPAEIENAVLEHPSVAEVAVVGAPDARWGEIVVCFVRLEPDARLDQMALVAHCRERLSPQKTPAHWVSIDAWPLTGSGKIQKFVLQERFAAGEFEPA
jgi:fatty-acyl-CoA synthase